MEMTITTAAERFMRRMLRLGGEGGSGFRLVVMAGGCSGLSGTFTIERHPLAGDVVYEHNGIPIFLPAQSRLLLSGVTIDFADTPIQTGLVFHDPQAAGVSCGSGGKDSLPAQSSVLISNISRRH